MKVRSLERVIISFEESFIFRQTFKNIHAMLKPNGQTFNVFLLTIPTDPVHAMLCKHEKWGKCGHEQMLSPYSSRAFPENCFREVLERTGLNYYFSVEKTSYTFSNEAEWKGKKIK